MINSKNHISGPPGGLLDAPETLRADCLVDEFDRRVIQSVVEFELNEAFTQNRLPLFAQIKATQDGAACLVFNDLEDGFYYRPLINSPEFACEATAIHWTVKSLAEQLERPLTIFPHRALTAACRRQPDSAELHFGLLGYQQPPLDASLIALNRRDDRQTRAASHLDRLEAESIDILREAVAEAENPAMMYSIGKDSSVMLHLAQKAFYPSRPPFPLLHIDTRWKFQQMYDFRDLIAKHVGMELLIHTNPEAIEKDINPFDHGSAIHTDITKTEGLKQALMRYRFDVVFGGARRDEEKSRAKERIFSFRTRHQQWDPKNQRPELWNLYNTRKSNGESMRVFPLSNWTEADIWQYIYREKIPLVPLYFARERPVIERDGLLLLVDDNRLRLRPGERIQRRSVRFRTLGCYPLTGAVESEARTLAEVVLETFHARTSERQGRAIDADSSGSMERKKKDGYF